MPSADEPANPHADFSFADLVAAYFACRRTKRNSASALAFEQDLERNLIALHDELAGGAYRPGRSICFVITKPKPREVWAAAFRDRIDPEELLRTANSYFGLLRQASHSHRDRAQLANLARRRGHSVNRQLTQIYKAPPPELPQP